MNNNQITLNDMKIACYLYDKFTDSDRQYRKLIEIGTINLTQKEHTKKLIEWLRNWGCRQFKKENEELSIANLMTWFSKYSNKLPHYNTMLLKCTEEALKGYPEIFDSLSNTIIAERIMKNKNTNVTVGPVGASKILFALRPNLFAPWDTPIYKYYKYKSTGESYINYLKNIKQQLEILQGECRSKGLNIDDVPKNIGRNISTLPKIIDEYNWVTITRKCRTEEIIKLFQINS